MMFIISMSEHFQNQTVQENQKSVRFGITSTSKLRQFISRQGNCFTSLSNIIKVANLHCIAPMMFLSSAFFPFWPEMFDSAWVLISTKMFRRLNARVLGTPLACSSALLIIAGEAVTSYFLCPMYPKDKKIKK